MLLSSIRYYARINPGLSKPGGPDKGYLLHSGMEKYGKLLNKAIDAGRKRDYKEAIKLLTQVITESDGYPQAYLYLGRSYHALKEFNRAVIYLQFFCRMHPESSAANFFLGRAYLAAGIPAKALPHLERAVETGNNSKPLILLGLTCLKVKDFGLAVEYLGRAVELEPDNSSVYTAYLNALYIHALKRFNSGDFELAGQILSFLSELNLNSVSIHLYLAKILREQQDYNGAALQYTRAAALEPDDELIQLQLADSLNSSGKTADASRILENIYTSLPGGTNFTLGEENVDPLLAVRNFQESNFRKAVFHGCRALKHRRDADMHLLVGESYRNIGSLTKAENHFNQVLKGNPGSSEAQMGLAMTEWQRGNWKGVINHLTPLLKNQRYSDLSRYYIVLCKSRLDYPPEETLQEVIQEIRDSGPDQYLLSALGDQYIRNDMPELAVKWFKKSLVLNPEYTPAKEGLTACYRSMDDTENLMILLKDILARDNSNIPVRMQLVDLLYEEELYTEAAKEAEALLGLTELNTRLQRLLAICYRKTGRYRDAAVIYRELLKEDPESEVFLRSLLFCLDKCRRRKQALDLLEKAIAYLQKPSASLLLIHGVFLHKEKDVEKALSAFRAAMDKAPKDWRPYYNIGRVYEAKDMKSFATKFFKKAEELKISEKRA